MVIFNFASFLTDHVAFDNPAPVSLQPLVEVLSDLRFACPLHLSPTFDKLLGSTGTLLI